MEKKKLLPVVLAATVISTQFALVPQAFAISDVKVTADDYDTEQDDVEYKVKFTLDEPLDSGQKFYINFDSDFDLSEVDEDDVDVDVEYRSITVDDDANEIIVKVDEDLDEGDTIKVTIPGVINPEDDDDYDVTVYTDNDDDDEEYDTVTIGDGSDSSSDGDYSVDLSDETEGANSSYDLDQFDLDSDSDDLQEGEWVTVTFPDADMLPDEDDVDTEDVEINGYEVDDIRIDDDEVELKIPEDVDGDDYLEISFSEDFGITNPDAGDYTITVTYDGVDYESDEFTIDEDSSSSASSDFSVSLSDTAAGARSSYSFEADFGSKKLHGGDDVIVEFPSSDMIPGILTASDVTVNGKPAKRIYKSGNKVWVTASDSMASSSNVEVEFSYSAWITNPKTPGSYDLKMTVDGKTITSRKFTITNVVAPAPTPTPAPVPATPVDNSTSTVSLTRPYLWAATGINIGINGVNVPLVKGQDFLTVVVPAGFKVPPYIAPANVTVNGIPASYVSVLGNNIAIYPAQDIPAGTRVNVVINQAANIVTAGQKTIYTFGVYSSKEKGILFARPVGIGGAVVPSTPTPSTGTTLPANAASIKLNVANFTKGGKTFPLTAAPYLANGSTTMVPAQFFKDGLALTTQWNNSTVAIISGTNVIRLTVGSNKARVGVTEATLPAAVVLKNGMPMVPLRFITDRLGYKVVWDAKTASIGVYK
ncbi:copper amine oxidase N-terminal domain-containing protein [Brevibacillus sp. SYP-B805]|uniref:copper amine oxidase N-terminal domain-containing protein n=1 Tax=Brevibacillus sp. SYP-B805 TaxID=1578199 RepID=UPI0013EA3DFA|nr:copper amine oxidase N-terminal domain-containing protein [Brevibacillus sp. SYP-B805]NGQ94673.1 copper amine oxidase N-terminal domain-containing protein [Brevibacillus sp. SYP-B805]